MLPSYANALPSIDLGSYEDAKAGKLTFAQTWQIDACVSEPQRRENSTANYARGLPNVAYRAPVSGKLAIVGSGPSAKDYIPELLKWDGTIWAINGAFNWLRSEGVRADFIGMDPEPFLVDYLKDIPEDATYYIANQVHPSILDHLNDRNVRLWHAADPAVKPPIGVVPINGGSTCMGRAPYLASLLGWSDVHLFGGDSSFRGEDGYAYGGRMREDTCRTSANGKWFTSTKQMTAQAYELVELCKNFPGSITVHGDGLLPEMAVDAHKVHLMLQKKMRKLMRKA